MSEQAPTGNLQERKDYKDYVILGVGEGGGSMGEDDMAVVNRYPIIREKIDKGAQYISIEALQRGNEFFNEPRAKVEARYSKIIKDWQGPKRVFTEGNANDLFLPDESVDEIWIENVFGDPAARFGYKTIEELRRVLAINGSVYVFESYTPDLTIDLFEELKADSPDFDVEIYLKEDLICYLSNELKMSERMARLIVKHSASPDHTFMAVLKKR